MVYNNMKLQQNQTKTNIIQFVYLPKVLVEILKWNKGDELYYELDTTKTKICIGRKNDNN